MSAADAARAAVTAAGGLVTVSEAARRWGMSTARASALLSASKSPPDPVAHLGGSRRLWAWRELDEWREARLEVHRRNAHGAASGNAHGEEPVA